MRHFLIISSILGAALAAGCASTASPTAGAAAAQPGPAVVPASEQPTLTGSRLRRTTSDRTVRGTDNASFRDENNITSLGNVVGATSR